MIVGLVFVALYAVVAKANARLRAGNGESALLAHGQADPWIDLYLPTESPFRPPRSSEVGSKRDHLGF